MNAYTNKYSKPIIPAIVLAGMTLMAAGSVWGAGSDTDNISITGTVVNSCVINSTAAVAFGDYDPAFAQRSTALTGQGTVKVQCTDQAPYTIYMGAGGGTGAACTGTPVRTLAGPSSNTLSYALYSDSGRASVWGCEASNDVAGTGNGAEQTLTVYGSIPGGQQKPAGAYEDTVVVTVNY